MDPSRGHGFHRRFAHRATAEETGGACHRISGSLRVGHRPARAGDDPGIRRGHGGPLFSRIREELGLAYQVGATQFLGHDTGLFTFYLATSPEQVELARAELLAEIGNIANHGIPDEAFERVRATVLSGLALQQQSPGHTARHIALDLLFGHAADEHRRLPAIYQNLSAESVREIAARILSVEPAIATVLPE
jgi:zinc protease